MQRRQRPSTHELDLHLTDLMKAVICQDVELVKAIIESGADLEARDRKGQNVLYHALPLCISENAMRILKLLIANGININSSMDSDGCSALVTAIVTGFSDVVSLLIENNVDVDDPAMSKFCGCLSSDSSLEMNNVMNSYATSQIFFSKGCGHFLTPLLCAVMYRQSNIAQVLVRNKARVECLSSGSFWRASGQSVCSNCEIQITPLHLAAYIGDLEITHLLLNHTQGSADVDHTNPNFHLSYNDISPLWFSLLQGHETIVKLLLTVGKPIAPPCHFGSGLEVCLQEGHVTVAHMLLRAGYSLEDDMDWIQNGKFPTKDKEVIDKILSLAEEPRPLLECCCSTLREKFGFALNDYLNVVGAPNKVVKILDFYDLSKSSWRIPTLKQLDIDASDR